MRTTNRLPFLVLTAASLAACGSEPQPATIHAAISPSRVWYQTDQMIQLTGVVRSEQGEELTNVEVRWTAEPVDGVREAAMTADPRASTFVLNREGSTTFTGCVVPTDAEQEPTLCDSLTIRVDDGTPALELATPSPGAQLDDPEGIVVRGSVADRGMTRVYVNGQPAEVDSLGRFERAVDARFGVNHLVVSASDGLTDEAALEMDVLWAAGYTPAVAEDGTPELVLNDGLALWLGQAFFDDGARLDPSAMPIVAGDVADILELIILELDVSSLVPDPVSDSAPFDPLRVSNVTLGEPRVEMDLTEDGADIFVRIGRIGANTSGFLTIDTDRFPLAGTITGSAVAYAHVTIRKDTVGSDVFVDMGPLTVGIETLEGNFESPDVTAAFQLAEGPLRATLEDTLGGALEDSLQDTVPTVLGDAVRAIDTALADREVPLDAEPFPPVTIQLDGRIRNLRMLFRREMLANLTTRVGTATRSVHPESRGVARIDVTDRALPFVNDGSLQIGVRLALLNGLLHGLWASGMLDVDATPLLPESILGLVSEARLLGRIPPVLRPPAPGEEHDLMLSLGQMELELMFMGEPVRFALTLEAGVDFELEDNVLSIDVSEEPTLYVWTLQPPSDPRLLTADIVRMMLLDLWPDLRMAVAGGLTFEIPLPALGDLGGLAPGLTGLSLQVDRTEEVRLRRGVLVMPAQMTAPLSAP